MRQAPPGLPATDAPFDHVIYVVTDPGVPAYGRKGASSHVQSVLRELTRRVHGEQASVTLVATRVDGEVPEGLEAVDVIEFGRPHAKDPAVRERMVADLDTRAAEEVERILATHGDPARTLVYQRYSLWSAQVMERASAAGARTVLEVNAPLVEEQATHRVLVDRAGAQETTVRALRAAEVVYAVSSAVAEWAASTAGLARGAVAAIPNGVDLQRFVPARTSTTGHGIEVTGATDHATDSVTTDAPTVAFVGTFRPWHAPDMLVEAAARLQARGMPVRLLLVGEGPMLQDTIDRAAAAGVAVEASGAVDPARVPELLAGADLAAAPYPAGPAYFSPLKVAEYLAAGLPTVASAVADLPHLFSTDEVALVAPGDTDAFTGALARLVTDPAERARLSAAGLAAATDRFGWSAVVDRVLATLERREAA